MTPPLVEAETPDHLRAPQPRVHKTSVRQRELTTTADSNSRPSTLPPIPRCESDAAFQPADTSAEAQSDSPQGPSKDLAFHQSDLRCVLAHDHSAALRELVAERGLPRPHAHLHTHFPLASLPRPSSELFSQHYSLPRLSSLLRLWCGQLWQDKAAILVESSEGHRDSSIRSQVVLSHAHRAAYASLSGRCLPRPRVHLYTPPSSLPRLSSELSPQPHSLPRLREGRSRREEGRPGKLPAQPSKACRGPWQDHKWAISIGSTKGILDLLPRA